MKTRTIFYMSMIFLVARTGRKSECGCLLVGTYGGSDSVFTTANTLYWIPLAKAHLEYGSEIRQILDTKQLVAVKVVKKQTGRL